jgi:hypothetical protein
MIEVNPLDIDRQSLIREYNEKVSGLKQAGVTDLVGQSFLDENDNPTILGETHITLMDEGLINPDGSLTDKGSVFNTTYKESLDAPEQVYIQREKLGLNELDKANEPEGQGFFSSMGDALTEFSKNVWSVSPARVVAKAGLDLVGKEIDIVSNSVNSLFGEEQSKKKTNISPSFLDAPRTGAEMLNAQASMVQGGLDTLFMAGGAMQYLPARAAMTIQGKEDLQLAIKQRQERDKRTFEEVNGAELLDSMIGIDTLMKNRQNLIAQVGEEAVAKQERGNRIAGGFIYDPINIASAGVGVMSNAGLKTALWAERTALVGRGLALEASELAARRANLEAKMTKASSLVDHTTERAAALNTVGDSAGAMRYNAHATRAAELVTNLTGDIEGIAARQAIVDADLASIASKQQVAQKIINTTEKYNAIRQMPANAVAGVTGAVGEGLMKTDAFVSSVMDNLGVSAVYDAFKAMPTQVASLASTSVVGPIGAVTSAVSTALGKGPLLKSISNFSRVVGEQVVKERGSSSFWRRVANAGVDKPQRMFAKFMDEATLGGSATQAAKIVAKGTAHAYPMNLTFELLQDPDLDVSNAAARSVAPSLIFGGGGAGAAQIFKGSAGRLKDVRDADHINMIRSLTDSQKSTFYKMDTSGQQVASSYAAAYPNLNWEFKESGASNYDPASNTVSVNINTNNPLRALITHEVLHYGTIKNNLVPVMNQLLFGFDGEGGLVKSKDGTLDPHFQKFMDEYNARLDKAGLPPAPLDKIGEEYFIESTVDHVLDVVDRGKLAEYTGRTESSRMISNLVRTFVEQRPILRDLFFKTGGVYDSNGRMVQGNGILNGGIMSHPESRKLVQKMLRESAGDTNLAMGKPAKKLDKGKLVVDETSPVVDSFHAILEYDSNGNPVKVDGVHKTISRQVDDARSMAGLILTEAQSKRVAGGYMPNAGELSKAKDGSWQGRYIHRALFDELSVKSALNSKQIAILKDISRATELNEGTRFLVVNHPATIKGRGGKVRYASLEATLRDVVPTAFSVTKQGNILVHLMSVDQLNANIEKRAASKTGDRLYGNNTELIKQDVSAMMDLHSENKVTDGYYQDKYGANWKQHKDFINTVFGLMTKEQRSYNPMFDADKIGDGGVFRTYRADRISRAVKDHAAPMPMGYEHIKVNMLPEGVPASTEARNTKELIRKNDEAVLAKKGFKVERSNFRYLPEAIDKNYLKLAENPDANKLELQKIIDERARQMGYTTGEVYHGTKQSFNEFKSERDITKLIYFSFDKKFAESYPRGTGGHREPTPDVRKRIDDVQAEKETIFKPISDELEKKYPSGSNTEDELAAWTKYFDDQKEWEKGKLDGMTISQAEMEMGIKVIPAYLQTNKIFDPATGWKEFKNEILDYFNEKTIDDLEPRTIKYIEDGNYLVWENKKIVDAVFEKYDGLILNESGSRNIAVRDPSLIKRSDAIVKDDKGNIIPPSKRFYPTTDDIRYLPEQARMTPEPLSPKTYANQKGYDANEILKSKLDDNGKIILTRPISPNGALPLLRDRRQITKEISSEARNQFAYDDIAKVSLYKNNGSDVYFNFDPNTQVKPVFKDAAAELAGKNVQIAMADRATAANGDMGGILFPNLKVNQITFTGGDGVKYRPVWANMGWKPVSSMKTKAIDQGSVNLMTYIMGKDAHASNIRTARTVSNEIENAGLKKVHKDLFTTLASYGDMVATNASHTKTISKHSAKVSELWVKYKNPNKFIDSQNPSMNEIATFKAKTKKDILKLTKFAKDAKSKIVEIPSEFKALLPFIRSYRNASTRFTNGNGSLANKNARLNDLETYMKSSNFKKLSANYSGRQLIDISSTFDGRKAAVDATTGLEFEKFSTDKVIESLGEFDGATNNQVLGSVELSSNPDLFAIYLGNDPKQIKFMSESEKLAAKHYKEHPDFVQHEAYEWVMLGPENGNHFLNSNPQKLVDYFSDFGDKYEQATGKRPQTENSSVGAMRDGLGVVLQMPETTQQ